MSYILKRWDGGVTLVAWATNGGRPQAAEEAVAADGVVTPRVGVAISQS